MSSPAASAQRVTHGGNVDTAVRDVDLDDLYTYAHLSFDLDTVGEYRQAQRVCNAEKDESEVSYARGT